MTLPTIKVIPYFILLLVNSGFALERFGCMFDNDTYGLKQNNLYATIFGDPVDPLYINISQFFDIKGHLEGWNGFVMNNYNHNSLDVFLDFFNDFKNSGIRFLEFFEEYTPTFTEGNLCYSQAIEVMNLLISQFEFVKDHVYLTTAHPSISNSLMNRIKDLSMIPDYFSHAHTAAVLKFTLMPSNREGHMLVDPGYGMKEVIVVMKDGESPHQGRGISTFENSYGQYFDFQYLQDSGEKYIVATRDNPASLLANDQDCLCNLFYVEKPLCSFLESTTKRRLVNTFRIILKRNQYGFPVAGMLLDLATNRSSFKLVLYPASGHRQHTEVIRFDELQTLKENNIYKIVTSALNVNKNYLFNKIKTVKKISEKYGYFLQHLANKKEQIAGEVYQMVLADMVYSQDRNPRSWFNCPFF